MATCIHALELEAKKRAELQAMEDTKGYRQRRDWREISRIARESVRHAIIANRPTEMPEDLEIDLGNHFAKTALELIFAILEGHRDEPLARKLIGRMARELVVAWDEEPRYAAHRARRSTKCIRNHELEFLMKEQVARFVMTLAPAEALAVPGTHHRGRADDGQGSIRIFGVTGFGD